MYIPLNVDSDQVLADSSYDDRPLAPLMENTSLISTIGLPRNTYHQLVILGNGFDKACGLRSSFWEFFELRMEPIKKIEAQDDFPGMNCAKGLRAVDTTAWDLILYVRKEFAEKGWDVRWRDVESAIADVLGMTTAEADARSEDDSGVDGSHRVSSADILLYYSYCKKHGGIRNANQYEDKVSNDALQQVGDLRAGRAAADDSKNEWDDAHAAYRDANLLLPNPVSGYVGQFLSDLYPRLSEGDRMELHDVLFAELRSLESRFSAYLKDAIEKTVSCTVQSGELLKRIMDCDAEYMSMTQGDLHIASVLNFNYSRPLLNNPPDKLSGSHCIDMHGVLGGETVFGVDGTGYLNRRGLARFTKAYRVLGGSNKTFSGPVAYPPSEVRVGWTETVAIKFFGIPSRGQVTRISSPSSTSLTCTAGMSFSTSSIPPHGDNCRQNLMDHVAKLLSAYGEALDNKAHGKNLMHKLMLEGRPIIRELIWGDL